MTKLFFATDLHGSDICWRKFLNAGRFYEADLLILGGEMTDKAIVPFIHRGGKNFKVTLLKPEFPITDDDELADIKKRVRSCVYFPGPTNPGGISDNRVREEELLDDKSLQVATDEHDLSLGRIRNIQKEFDETLRSIAWQMRDKVGTRVRRYMEVEEENQ